jgi:hypothetical protein
MGAARGRRGWSAVDFALAAGLFALVATVAGVAYVKSSETMNRTLGFMRGADQLGASYRDMEKNLAQVGAGAPMEYPASGGLTAKAPIVEATATAVTYLGEVDKEASFLKADAEASATQLRVTSLGGFQVGDTILIFERYFTVESRIAGLTNSDTITLTTPLPFRLKERAQVSRPRRVRFYVEDDLDGENATGRKRIVWQETRYEDPTVVLKTKIIGRGMETVTFSYWDKSGNQIPVDQLLPAVDVQGARRRDIREIRFDIQWPAGGVSDRPQKIQTRIRPFNLKRDRTN